MYSTRMDTFKLYVFSLTCITLIFVQTNVDAALGSDCSANSTVCDTSKNENCTGTTCVCDDGYFESGDSCASTTVKVYGDGCTAASSEECNTGFECVSSVNKCLCPDGFYYTGSTCTSTNVLKPTMFRHVKTHNSVTLSWTSRDAANYTNRYDVHGINVEQHNVNGQDVSTLIPSLSPGTTYTFTVVRSITREGRTQAVQASDPYQVTTNGIYSESCSAVGESTECKSGLMCVSGTSGNFCLCQQGLYFTESTCRSTDKLKPAISGIQSTSTTSVTINWTSLKATGYTNSYAIKYTEQGATFIQNTSELGNVFSYILSGLKAGTSYTFIVVRYLSRQGRTQAIDSVARIGTPIKINYGGACVSNGTCANQFTNCFSSVCSCNYGFFWNRTCLQNANLIVTNIHVDESSSTQLSVTWNAPAYPEMVTEYLLEVKPSVLSENISITGTSAIISSLTSGERYNITVSSKSKYLNRGETAVADLVHGITKPVTTEGLAEATSLMEPIAQIYFFKAGGRADSYTVTLTREDYTVTKTSTGTGDTLSANFPDVVAGLNYTLTIISNSYNVSSDPFTQIIRVKAAASEAVVDLSADTVTSRAAALSWKRPVNPKGVLYKYGMEVFNSSTCLQRINIQCTDCTVKSSINSNESIEISCKQETDAMIAQSNLNDLNFMVRYNLSLLPVTTYIVFVAAYNEEGRGNVSTLYLTTEQEAPGDPTTFRDVSKTSESVELRWTPPEPRPGVTTYIITVYEWDEDRNEYKNFKNVSTLGFYNVSINATGLSSFWKYRFEMYAKTIKGDSNTTNVPDVTTLESAPTVVELLEHQPVDGVYNRYQLSWRCPPQKDGRNGVIISATVITSSFTKSDNNPATGKNKFDNTDCTWNEKIKVTPEFNYTFEVYISNSVKGESTRIQRYMPAGPASLSSASVPADKQKDSIELKTISVVLCPSCIVDRKNGIVISTGIIVCKGSCNTNRRKRQTRTEADYKLIKTWRQSQKNSFNDPYRTTTVGWLAGIQGSDSIKYIIGNDTKCAEKSEANFCNGPLEEGTTYIIIVFACTSAGCDETEEVSISTAETPSNIGGIIGGVVGVLAGVFVVIIAVIVVRRRRARPTTFKRKLDDHSDDEELILKKRPIQIKNFEKRVEEMHRDSNLLFSEEFEDINALSPKEKCIASETNGNKLKNRYVNILPFDATRVKLRQTEEDEEGSDYINANYIPGYSSPREYIATQGPMTGTITDFWRMIWEQNVPIIIMLSDLQEKGKPKVDRYYPENMEPVQYGDIVLEMTNFSPLNKYVIRIFKLQVGEEVRMVRHYFLPGWQDFGANLNSDDVIDFVKNVRREIKPNNTGPMCVHCSAGVGRTGTYIALDVFQQHIDEEKLDKEIDIFDFVLKMRYNRSYMVQTEKQYIFIHDTIKEMVIKKKKELAERDNIYMNNENTGGDDIYVNQAFETDPQDIYMNVDNSSGKPTTVL